MRRTVEEDYEMINFYFLYGAVGAVLIGMMQLLFWAADKNGETQRQFEPLG
jgi:hypothetical protein